MLTRIASLPGGGTVHYVLGGAYVLAHLLTHQLRVRVDPTES